MLRSFVSRNESCLAEEMKSDQASHAEKDMNFSVWDEFPVCAGSGPDDHLPVSESFA